MPGRASERGMERALRDGGRATVGATKTGMVTVRKRARGIVQRTSAAAAAIGAFAAMAAAGASGTNLPDVAENESAQVMFLAQIAHGPGAGAGTRVGVPNAVGAAAKLWRNGRREVALAMSVALVACEEPHALVLWARIHEESTDPDIAREVGEAYAKAALRGHPGGRLALARNDTGKGTDAGNIAAYAHLIVRVAHRRRRSARGGDAPARAQALRGAGARSVRGGDPMASAAYHATPAPVLHAHRAPKLKRRLRATARRS